MLSACVASKIDQHPVLAGKSSLYCRRLKIFTLPALTTPGNNESPIYCCGINAAVYIWWGCAARERTACESNQRFVISAAPTINTQVVKFASKSLSLLFCSLWLFIDWWKSNVSFAVRVLMGVLHTHNMFYAMLANDSHSCTSIKNDWIIK